MNINYKEWMSPIGLGCWPLGGDQWGRQENGESIDTIRSAYEAGVTHFDTAQAYGRGHGEELIGKTLNDVRDHIVIATKAFFLPKEKVEAAVTASLKRLQTDWIDIFYIHWPKKGADLQGMMESLERLREKKIIRCIGVSNFSVRDMQEVMKAGVIDYCQVCYNILWRRGEGELIPFCNQNNIGIVTYSSLAEGILTGKFGKEVDFPKDDHRKYTVFFDKDLWPKIYESVEKLKVVASRGNLSLTHCAIQWLLAKQGVVSVLTGARNPSQIKNNLAALKLESVDKTMLEKLTEISNHLAPLIPDIGNIFKWYP